MQLPVSYKEYVIHDTTAECSVCYTYTRYTQRSLQPTTTTCSGRYTHHPLHAAFVVTPNTYYTQCRVRYT
jgi:hypothetical protein